MRRAVTTIFLLSMLCTPVPALALTGAQLLSNCSASIVRAEGKHIGVDPYKAGLCVGYLQGFGAGADIAALGASSSMREYRQRRVFCVPEGVTNLRVMRVVVAALRDEPADRLRADAETTVGLALRRAFPCR